VFIATSEIHLKHMLKMDQEQVLHQVQAMVTHARNLCPTVEFSAADATRSDWDYLCRVFETAIKAGASTINIPDTVGYTLPHEYEALFRYLRERVPGMNDVIMSAHCHNDLGMATANTLAAISAGARQVEVTVNGLGERAGNTALEEVVMALRTRPEVFGNVDTHINARELLLTSQLVSDLTGIVVQPNKAVVGSNAFAHEAAMHQDGMLINRMTYEIMTPESIGLTSLDRRMHMGKLSGRAALAAQMRDLGYELEKDHLNRAFDMAKLLLGKKKVLEEMDMRYIAEMTMTSTTVVE